MWDQLSKHSIICLHKCPQKTECTHYRKNSIIELPLLIPATHHIGLTRSTNSKWYRWAMDEILNWFMGLQWEKAPYAVNCHLNICRESSNRCIDCPGRHSDNVLWENSKQCQWLRKLQLAPSHWQYNPSSGLALNFLLPEFIILVRIWGRIGNRPE